MIYDLLINAESNAVTNEMEVDDLYINHAVAQWAIAHGIPARASAGVLDAKTHSVAVEAGGANVPVEQG